MPVCLSSCLPVSLVACLPVCLFACFPVCLSAFLLAFLFTGLTVCLSARLLVYLSAYLPVCLYDCLPVLSACLFASLPVCLSAVQITTDDLLQAALLEEGGYPSPHEGGPMRQRQLALNEAALAVVAFNFPDFRNLQVVRVIVHTARCSAYTRSCNRQVVRHDAVHTHVDSPGKWYDRMQCIHTFMQPASGTT